MMGYYCLLCGSPLEKIELDDHYREACPSCGWIYYPHS